MANKFRFHWFAPFLMLGSFALAILLCFGHHLFYQSLEGSRVSSTDRKLLGARFTAQQVNIAGGTAFAFLAKAAFVLSVSTAYYQAFWKMARQSPARGKPPTLGRLDDAFSALNNILALANLPLWFRFPLLFVIAITAWLLPIASIITPATLSVDLARSALNVTLQSVPSLDLNTLGLVGSMPSSVGVNGISLFYAYNGPSQLAKKTAMAVAAGGFILPINSPVVDQTPNSSWSLEFYGPSLRCEDLAQADRLRFEQNIVRYLQSGDGCYSAAPYLACLARPTSGNDTMAEPYRATVDGNSTAYSWDAADAIFDVGIRDFSLAYLNASLYFAVMSNMVKSRSFTLSATPEACWLNSSSEMPVTKANPLGSVGGNITMLQCGFYNSSYRTDFEYINGVQSIGIALQNEDAATTVPVINLVRGAEQGGGGPSVSPPYDYVDENYCATLNEVGAYEIDASSTEIYGRTCDYRPELVSQLSYQATLQAFTNLVTGSIAWNRSAGGSSRSITLVDDSFVRSAHLLDTRELNFLTDLSLHTQTDLSTGPDLQHALRSTNAFRASGMFSEASRGPPLPLKDALETMFQNFTVSLMSEEAFRLYTTVASAASKASVTSYTYDNVYIYAEDTLWIAYGLASLFTLIAVCIGMYAIIANGATYDNNLSTVLRATRRAELSADVRDEDLSGSIPLPEHLRKATVALPGNMSGISSMRHENDVRNKRSKAGATASTALLKD